MTSQYGLITVDEKLIRRTYKNINVHEVKDALTTSYDGDYTLNQNCWAIHKIVLNTSMIYSYRYEYTYGLSDTIVIDNCGNIYKMYGVGDPTKLIECNIYSDYVFKTLTQHSVTLSNDVIDFIKNLTVESDIIGTLDKLLGNTNSAFSMKGFETWELMIKHVKELEKYIHSEFFYNTDLESSLAIIKKQNEELLSIATTSAATTCFGSGKQFDQHHIDTSTDIDKLQDLVISQSAQIRSLKNELTNYIMNDAIKS